MSRMTSTDELVSSLSSSLSCNEFLAESPSTSSSHVVERRRRSNRIVLGNAQHSHHNNQAGGSKRPSLGSNANRKRQSTDARLNFVPNPSVGTLPDRAISTDLRVLQNLKNAEMALAVNDHYFSAVQEYVQPKHREQAVDWLIDVTREERCDVDVLPLAVSLIDRYLSVQNISQNDIQALAGVCLFVASKLKAPLPLNADRIVYYTADSITSSEVLSWELLILHTLDWDLNAPTAFDFYDHMVARLPVVSLLRESFRDVVHKIQKNAKLGMLPPSMQCALSLLYAAEHYLPTNTLLITELVKLIPFSLGVDPVLVRGLMPQMERALQSRRPTLVTSVSSPVAPPSSCRTPSPQLTAIAPTTGLVTPMNDSGFCSGASSPESVGKKDMECSPPKAPRLA